MGAGGDVHPAEQITIGHSVERRIFKPDNFKFNGPTAIDASVNRDILSFSGGLVDHQRYAGCLLCVSS
jgi:hypothetical protein